MVAYAPYLVASASLSSIYGVSSAQSAPSVCKVATATVTQYATARPTTNPHGHGGPYYNPHNDIPPPFTWPGKPSKSQTYPPLQPSAPYEFGGSAKDQYEEPAWIPEGSGKLIPSLPNVEQCGNSQWGDINCPHLPVDGLPGGPSYPSPSMSGGRACPARPTISGRPYYSMNATRAYGSMSGTATPTDNSCPKMPNTGVTRTYNFHVAYQTIAPDGVPRNGITINGQFPGPLIEANWGDYILLKVTNELTDEGTALHAHGLKQSETPWYDGVPAVAMCPITPNGGTFNMLFRADRYGTSWYHSHYSAQYSGGAHGPVVIYGPRYQEYDIDIGPVTLEDWFHADYYSLLRDAMNGQFPPSNNNIINGRMNYPCENTTLPCTPNAGISKFKFESGKKHLLRLINAGAQGVQKFSIDGHQLKVIAVDMIPIEPYYTNVATLVIGQRTDVIVEAIGKPGDSYWMRSQLGQALPGQIRCSLEDGVSPNAVAAVYYEGADTDSVPQTTSSVTTEQLAVCKNDELTAAIPICKNPVAEPDVTQRIDFEYRSNGTNFIWYLNNQTYRGNYNQPVLLDVKEGRTTFEPEFNVYEWPNATNVRLHLVNHGPIGGHPMHLHGHDMQILAEGYGEWNGTVTNPENPLRRDVHQLQNVRLNGRGLEPSYMVLQFTQNNPGVWPLHCHLAWHVSGGMFMQILESREKIRDQEFGANVFELCDKWDAYTKDNVPNQIDSGQ